MTRSQAGAVIHRNLALIACDAAGTLQETQRKLGDLDITAVPLGDRHLLLPASQARLVLQRLKEHGQFPRLIGDFLSANLEEPEAGA
ncbi:MAG: hypothetical protein H6698_09870 [Myxococcales bacterium]|nr:hypothetical protein [Myxococcales bacterium]MCB9532336.1 hypothetical protein [Myxococcales bacterium]MCB9534590.1 hypothetical protein [Myxococcales bacterium]